ITSAACGSSGSRLNTVVLSVKRGLLLQIEITSAYAASSTPEGVARNLAALSFSLFHVSASIRTERLWKRGAATAAGFFASGNSGDGASVASRASQYFLLRANCGVLSSA